MKEQSYQAGIKLAIGTGREGTEILKAVERRAKELKARSRNAYIVGLIKKDLGWKDENGKR
jgi:hypothetical protein